MNYLDPTYSKILAQAELQIRAGWVTEKIALFLLDISDKTLRKIREGQIRYRFRASKMRYNYQDIEKLLNTK